MKRYQRLLAATFAAIAMSVAPALADGIGSVTPGFTAQNASGIWIDSAFSTGVGQTNNGLQDECADFTNTSSKTAIMVELNFAYVDSNDVRDGDSDQLSVKGTFPAGIAVQSTVSPLSGGVDGITCRMPSVALTNNQTVEASVIAVKYADGTSWGS